MYSDEEKDGLLESESITRDLIAQDDGLIKKSTWRRIVAMHLVLPISLFANVLMLIFFIFSDLHSGDTTSCVVPGSTIEQASSPVSNAVLTHTGSHGVSPYAKLSQSLPVKWVDESEYFGTTATTELASDAAWERIDINNGTIALSDEYAEAMGLPRSERFPWDHTKGIYHINAFHDLHCLKGIRSWVQATRRGETPHLRVHHILHCLDQLRQNVMCTADDTPRYSGFQHQFRTGTNQTRMCRDWSQLEAWAQKHTACFRLLHDKTPGMNLVGEYAFCPEGSPYQEEVDKFYARQKKHEGY